LYSAGATKNNLNQHAIQPNTQNTEVGIMASIYKRKNDNGTTVWRAVVRIKGYPSICNHFERKQEAAFSATASQFHL
jgi:hypothetical protein